MTPQRLGPRPFGAPLGNVWQAAHFWAELSPRCTSALARSSASDAVEVSGFGMGSGMGSGILVWAGLGEEKIASEAILSATTPKQVARTAPSILFISNEFIAAFAPRRMEVDWCA